MALSNEAIMAALAASRPTNFTKETGRKGLKKLGKEEVPGTTRIPIELKVSDGRMLLPGEKAPKGAIVSVPYIFNVYVKHADIPTADWLALRKGSGFTGGQVEFKGETYDCPDYETALSRSQESNILTDELQRAYQRIETEDGVTLPLVHGASLKCGPDWQKVTDDPAPTTVDKYFTRAEIVFWGAAGGILGTTMKAALDKYLSTLAKSLPAVSKAS